ncbi:molybdopterin-dependent oxidoreductase [Kineosporia sp. A_224]|uniref:molybdopterin-dependent oxidoreductase n=1 Tax=Kineosporia sp. A_224 TaxID=1962180 RepID=UPI000B4AB3B4|nr:molybdopterin-dependent oxidoreductase [Kineosporia sp. A_224]
MTSTAAPATQPVRDSTATAARWYPAVAGLAAACTALGAGELTTAALTVGGSLVGDVGSWFIDLAAGSLKDVAVAVFGRHDKAALVVGVVLTTLGLGAGVGLLASTRRWAGAAGFVAFSVVAAVTATSADPARAGALCAAAAVAAVTGAGTLHGLLALPGRGRGANGRGPAQAAGPGRRSVVVATAAAALGAAAAGSAVLVRRTRTPAPLAVDLPATTSGTAVAPSEPLAVPGLSPYVTPVDRFYRIDTALLVPRPDVRQWRLTVDGAVERPVTLTYGDLLELATAAEPVTLSCVSNEVGGDLVGNALWQGVPLSTLLERAGVRPGGDQVLGHSLDGFTAGFPTALALDGRPAMVAVGMNGEPLPAEHGYPARIVVAGLYGYVSAVKWLSRIELTGWDDADGYWIPRGWSKEGPIKTQSRIDVPRAGDVLAPGRVVVAGVAWAPTRGIRAVEVQVDAGPWERADVGAVASANTWAQWRWTWDAAPGTHTLAVRAVDGTGEPQVAAPHEPAPNGATGLHRREVTIRTAS